MIKGSFKIFPLGHGFLTVCEKQCALAFFAINEFIILLEPGDLFDWNQCIQKSGTVPPNLTEPSDFRVFAVRCIAPLLEDRPPEDQVVERLPRRKGRLGWVGLEPTTNALKGRCSTVELPTPSGNEQ